MARWQDVVDAEPEFAARAQALFDAHRHKTIATLRKDGAPRISGIEAQFGGGEVWVGERTHELIAGRIASDDLPPQQLKGMIAPIAMYRLHRTGGEQPPASTNEPDREMVGATR